MSKENVDVAIVGSGLSPLSSAAAAAMTRQGAGVVLAEPKQDYNTVIVDDAPNDPELQVKPKRSCVHCNGRGYIGTNAITKQKILCRCVRRDFDRVNKLKKEKDAKLKPSQITKDMGWERPKGTDGTKTVVSTK